MSNEKKPGRPKDETLSTAFEKVCEYIQQNKDDQLTVSSIRHKMRDFLPDNYEPFSNQILKQKIKDHFEGSITFSETKGLSDIISLSEQTSSILRLHYTKQFENEDKKKQLLTQHLRSSKRIFYPMYQPRKIIILPVKS